MTAKPSGSFHRDWFSVDKEGLAKVVARRNKGFVVNELVQNAWDTDATDVCVTLQEPKGGKAILTVADNDPHGFAFLSHAYTLFAESVKKGDAEKRGRFNLGEKLVLALCESARLNTCSGSIKWDKEGRSELGPDSGTKKGSEFIGVIKMTDDEYLEACAAVRLLLPPEGVKTVFNGERIPDRKPLAVFKLPLQTEIADEEGRLRHTTRNATVRVYTPRDGEPAHIYEMGIPVVPTGDRWHYNIGQKVPLNVDRDNVTPAYLQEIRAAVLNEMSSFLEKEDATQKWVRDALESGKASKEATTRAIELRFGEKRVIYDPSDPQGSKQAMEQGYTVISPGSLSRDEWAAVKQHSAALPAGQVTPSPKPYSPDGDPLKKLPPEKWTHDIKAVAGYAHRVAEACINRGVTVSIAVEFSWPYGATYGGGDLTLNLGRLGHAWFKPDNILGINKLLIHEFAHEYESDHLSAHYHESLCLIGARLLRAALENPKLFELK